jgi:WD40 repeat protein
VGYLDVVFVVPAGGLVWLAAPSVVASHDAAVTALTFLPSRHRVVSGGNDHTVRGWDSATGEQRGGFTDHHAGGVLAVAIAPDSKWLATIGHDGMRIWDAATGERPRRITGPNAERQLALERDESAVIDAAGAGSNPHPVMAGGGEPSAVRSEIPVQGRSTGPGR